MTDIRIDADQLAREHRALLTEYGRVQARCSEVIAAQAREIASLQAEAVRLRAAVVVRDTLLATARQAHTQLEAAIPGLPRRIALAQRVEWLVHRVQGLMRERLRWQARTGAVSAEALPAAPAVVAEADLRARAVLCVGQDKPGASAAQRMVEQAGGQFFHHDGSESADAESSEALEASLVAADLVICQTGCVSHQAYWRVQDHCKRTGKQCVLVDQPQAMLFVRSVEAAALPAEALGER